jgi:hypothetical protein
MKITLDIEREDAEWVARQLTCVNPLTMERSPIGEDVAEQIREAIQNADHAAYERHQEELLESGGVDDSKYRADMRDAGRGHLLR